MITKKLGLDVTMIYSDKCHWFHYWCVALDKKARTEKRSVCEYVAKFAYPAHTVQASYRSFRRYRCNILMSGVVLVYPVIHLLCKSTLH